jgi:cyclophilin family peptidyl-prolyl cis-trans isomerase
MKRLFLLPLLIGAAPVAQPVQTPNEIVAAAPALDWVAIAPSDLMVMNLAADAKGKPRRVIIQLMPPPFSQGWIGNIRKLAAAQWWDGTSINRVQDNYVVQWGDATEKKAMPMGLVAVSEANYVAKPSATMVRVRNEELAGFKKMMKQMIENSDWEEVRERSARPPFGDLYAQATGLYSGWPYGADLDDRLVWPIHCYGMVGVGRDMPPNTGTGAELYTVIGHAPRHLDRNIALVGRVIEGIEHLSSLPRGTGALGFYEKAEERVPILSVRIGSEVNDVPRFEYLSTESVTFAHYADARANRRDPFFIKSAGGADICNIPVPVRRAKQ